MPDGSRLGTPLLLAASLLVCTRLAAPAELPIETGLSWSAATNGLRIAVGTLDPRDSVGPQPEFVVAFENVGREDFVVNLGLMGANARMMLPTAIALILTDPGGRERELRVVEGRGRHMNPGNVDDYIVALRSGATYRYLTNIGEYLCHTTKESNLRLTSGRYRIKARFEGDAAQYTTGDVKVMTFWRGNLESPSVEFRVIAQETPRK